MKDHKNPCDRKNKVNNTPKKECVCNIYINYTYVGCMCIYLSTQREKNIKCDKILIFEGSE